MATTSTPTTLASRLKERYKDGISNLIPTSTVLLRKFKFKEDLAPGEKARFDIQLDHEQGFSVGQGEITLNPAVAQNTAKVEVEGYSVILRSRVSYDLITRAKTTKQAFATFHDKKFIPMTESYQKRCEILAKGYGRQGLGVVSANSSGVLTITPGSWNAPLWLGMKGAVLEAFTSTATGATQHNGDLTVSAINVANKTVTVTGTSSAVVANDILFLKDCHVDSGSAPYGLMDIAKNNATLYNINASTEALWKSNTYNVGTSALTLGKILEAAGYSADMGCDEKLTCTVPVKAFQGLVADESALRSYDAKYSKAKAENGFEAISFYGATGEIEVIPYMFEKEGEFVMFPERYMSKIGSSDMTNQLAKDGDIVFDLENTSAKEMRLFSEWTVFCERPAWITWGNRSDGLALHT